jgi:hypothetical protein
MWSPAASAHDLDMTYITCTNIVDGNPDDYSAITANLPTTEPDGLISRFAGLAGDTFVIVAAWTSKSAWDRFAAEQLGPAVRAAQPANGSGSTLEFEATDEFIDRTVVST